MHIPDGFLDTKVWLTLDGVSALAIGYAVKRAGKVMSDKHVPMLGILSAFLFAAQMINFPILGGTSGHFLGATFVGIILGPWASVLILSAVLLVQCLLLQDGGITALGANIFNMGIVAGAMGYYIYYIMCLIIPWSKTKFLSGFLAAWLGTAISASACAIELALSKTVPMKVALTSMVSVYLIIGLAEGLITVAALAFLKRLRPDLLELEKI